MIRLRAAGQLDPAHVPVRALLARPGAYDRAPALIDAFEADPATQAQWQIYLGVPRQEYASVEAMTLSEAVVCGQGAVVTAAQELVQESVAEFTAHGLIPDGLGAHQGTDGYALARPITRRIEQPCLLVKRPWFRSYGHWLIDAAPIVALLAARCRSHGMAIVVGRCEDEAMRQVMADTLRRLAPGAEILEHRDDEVWSCRSLTYVTPFHIPPLFKLPAGLSRLRSAMLNPVGLDAAAAGPATVPPAMKRLFVSRSPGPDRSRILLNEDEIFAHCAPHGFERLRPEQMSVLDQARLFAEAAIVVGVKGAGLANIVFCPAGASVLALAPADFPDPFFWDIAGQRGLSYVELFGAIPGAPRTTQGRHDFRIDPERFRIRLAGLMRPAPSP